MTVIYYIYDDAGGWFHKTETFYTVQIGLQPNETIELYTCIWSR